MPRLRPAYITVASRKGRAPTKGSWAKGKSGNPSGRSKPGPDELLIREMCRKASPEIVTGLIELAATCKDPKTRVRASEVILDRGYGRPRQAVEISGRLDTGPDLSQYTDEELAALEAIHQSARARGPSTDAE